MNMQAKIDELRKLKDELNSHIWNIFHRYIDQEKILFSDPYDWKIKDNTIYFSGRDGCMGCYDDMGLHIPIVFFIDPDSNLALLKSQREAEALAKVQKEKAKQDAKDRLEFERLQKKFQNNS